MDKKTWTAMLERRGYTLGVHFVESQGNVTQCTVGDHEAGMTMSFSGSQFSNMTYDQACDYLDDTLGEEMRHVVHTCGQVLLEANDWWQGFGPYNDFEWGFYLVPLGWGAKSISRCPKCHQELSLEGVDFSQYGGVENLDQETYERLRLTALPRVHDPEVNK